MNYREWLLFWAQQYAGAPADPEVLLYRAWQSYQAGRKWTRSPNTVRVPDYAGSDRLGSALTS